MKAKLPPMGTLGPFIALLLACAFFATQSDRFLTLQPGAPADPKSHFHRFAGLSEAEALELARDYWQRINMPNLEQNIRPTRSRARLVLRKGPDHSVTSVLLRKI